MFPAGIGEAFRFYDKMQSGEYPPRRPAEAGPGAVTTPAPK